MRKLVIRRLFPITSHIDKIVLALQYDVGDWLPQAYADVCEADHLPSAEDIRRLGFEVFVKIARAREAFRPFALVDISQHPATIKQLFDLPTVPVLKRTQELSVNNAQAHERWGTVDGSTDLQPINLSDIFLTALVVFAAVVAVFGIVGYHVVYALEYLKRRRY
jgi:hypothetical protein